MPLLPESPLLYDFSGRFHTMSASVQPQLRSGQVYRTKDLSKWSKNPTRLASRLVREDKLVPLAHGLYLHPKRGRFGQVPADDGELMRGFLDGDQYIVTGPERWNALGLGTTAVFASPLVYNRKRSGEFKLGDRRFRLRRVAFPRRPTPEWFVVDLFQNAEEAGASRAELTEGLARAMRRGRFDRDELRRMARRFGSKDTQARIESAVAATDAPVQ